MLKQKVILLISTAGNSLKKQISLGGNINMSTEPFLGEIKPFGFNFAPRGYTMCNGQILAISTNTALFSLLGTAYGGDGQTTFGLPDLRGRTMVHQGQGNGLSSISLGEAGGSENVTLTNSNLPTHTHTATATSTLNAEGIAGNSQNPQGKLLGGLPNLYITPDPAQNKPLAPESIDTAVTVAPTGNSQPFGNRSPYLGLTLCIALEGIFPSRN